LGSSLKVEPHSVKESPAKKTNDFAHAYAKNAGGAWPGASKVLRISGFDANCA
jgi:hypothetical protein